MKSKWMTLTLLCSFLLNLFFIIGYFAGQSDTDVSNYLQRQRASFEHLVESLSLTKVQQDKFLQIKETRRAQNKPLRKTIFSKRQELLDLISQPEENSNAIETKLSEISQLHQKIQKNNLQHFLAFQQSLSTEQQQKLMISLKNPQKRSRRLFSGLF